MINTEEIKTGAEKYETPLYIFDVDEMLNTAVQFKKGTGNRADICFAMKANPFLVKQMPDLIDRIEVCSMGEYEICRNLGIAPEKLLISGVLKEKEDILKILQYYRGMCTYTIESPNQFYCLADWSEENREVVHVYLRLTSGNQFGMDEEKIRYLMQVSHKYSFLKIRGLHYFSGTQKRSLEKIKKELLYLDDICRRLGDISELEYGPGIPVAYFQNQKDEQNLYITGISEAIAEMKWKGKITLEMGRALVASCGYYLTRIKDIKQSNGKNYCIVDGGIHQLQYDGQIRGIYQPKVRVLSESLEEDTGENAKQEWTICGSLCTANDVLIQNLRTGKLKEDDLLVFEMAGAYAPMEGMALFLSHDLPAVTIFRKSAGWKLIREKQSTYQWNMEREIENGKIN